MCTTTIHVGGAFDSLRAMPTASVHCAVTSPPYWGLRDYDHPDQLGAEATPDLYVERVVSILDELGRVLRDDGTLWLNLGDTYATDAQGPRGHERSTLASGGGYQTSAAGHQRKGWRDSEWNIKKKDLLGLPWRVALALQASGWYLRSEVIWHKTNPMPESVRDRPARSHEKLFLLTKRPRYFYDDVAVREPSADLTNRGAGSFARPMPDAQTPPRQQNQKREDREDREDVNYSGATRTLRDVWTMSSRPFKGAHFAVMNPELAERCILAGTSARGCCAECGAPFVRQVERTAMVTTAQAPRRSMNGVRSGGDDCSGSTMIAPPSATTTGWNPSCACGAAAVPCVVLDPFGGAGTTAAVAMQHGRDAVLCEINAEYAEIARARLAAPAPLLDSVSVLSAVA